MNDVPVNKPTVLVVDDEPQIRRLLRVTLEANGYRVVEASTEQKSLTEAAQHRPDTHNVHLYLNVMSARQIR